MKWIAFIVILAAIPPLSSWLRRYPEKSPLVWMLVGFLPFVLANLHLYFAVDSWAVWPGYVKGAEFSVLDALAIALYFSLPNARNVLPFRFSMALYFLAIVFSAFQAKFPIIALFCAWQLARMFLLYAVISKASASPRVVSALMTGLAAALIMEAAVAIWERFGLGITQASGTLLHQNSLGLMSHFVVFPFFALVLAGQRGWFPPVVLLAGIIIEVLTGSRATLGLACFGYAALFMLSALRRWNSRKAVVLLIAAVMGAVFLPFALASIDLRGQSQMESSDAERVALNASAVAILSDHPLGIGSNHFVVVANTGGYYRNAGVAWTSDDAIVHNVYWLVAAETGYFGLIALVIVLFQPLFVAFRCAWRCRRDPKGDLLIGFGVALLVVYIHSGFEWIFLTFEPQYLFAMELGMIAGVAQQLGYWRPSHVRQPLVGVAAPSMTVASNKG